MIDRRSFTLASIFVLGAASFPISHYVMGRYECDFDYLNRHFGSSLNSKKGSKLVAALKSRSKSNIEANEKRLCGVFKGAEEKDLVKKFNAQISADYENQNLAIVDGWVLPEISADLSSILIQN